MKKNIVLWGVGGRTDALLEIIELRGFNIAAFFSSFEVANPYEGYRVFFGEEGFYEWKESLEDSNLGDSISDISFSVAIGFEGNRERYQIGQFLINQGLRPVSLIHPMTSIARMVQIGQGVQISIGATVDVGVSIGDFSILGTGPVISHHCKLGKGVHIAPGASLAGQVEIGDFVSIGTNATILPRVKVGQDSIIGAGTIVTRDVPERSVVIGNPGKVVRGI